MKALFHLAYHVTDLDAARRFYGGVLGCREGRSTDTWVDFDFFGHQISLHLGEPFRTSDTDRCASPVQPDQRTASLSAGGSPPDARAHSARAVR